MRYEGRIVIRKDGGEKGVSGITCVHTESVSREGHKYQNSKLREVSSFFFFSLRAQEAHVLSSNGHSTASVSSAY